MRANSCMTSLMESPPLRVTDERPERSHTRTHARNGSQEAIGESEGIPTEPAPRKAPQKGPAEEDATTAEEEVTVMAAKGIPTILSGYFNQGEGKRPLKEFADEMKALSPEEKMELAQGVCKITGDTVATK